jgi:hypothetical protein
VIGDDASAKWACKMGNLLVGALCAFLCLSLSLIQIYDISSMECSFILPNGVNDNINDNRGTSLGPVVVVFGRGNDISPWRFVFRGTVLQCQECCSPG